MEAQFNVELPTLVPARGDQLFPGPQFIHSGFGFDRPLVGFLRGTPRAVGSEGSTDSVGEQRPLPGGDTEAAALGLELDGAVLGADSLAEGRHGECPGSDDPRQRPAGLRCAHRRDAKTASVLRQEAETPPPDGGAMAAVPPLFARKCLSLRT